MGMSWKYSPRPKCQGGGIAVIVINNIEITANTHTFRSVECTSHKLKILSSSVYFNVIYRKSKINFLYFIEEMSQLLETSIMDNICPMYVGDFNLQLNNVDNPDICTFNEMLECFDITKS